MCNVGRPLKISFALRRNVQYLFYCMRRCTITQVRNQWQMTSTADVQRSEQLLFVSIQYSIILQLIKRKENTSNSAETLKMPEKHVLTIYCRTTEKNKSDCPLQYNFSVKEVLVFVFDSQLNRFLCLKHNDG